MLVMTKISSTIPVRTRLPSYAWAMAICVTLLASAATYFDQGHTVGEMKLAAAQGVPQGKDAPGAENGAQQQMPDKSPKESLSDLLDRNQGVITPPPTGDTDIYTTAPNPNPGTTLVIPPPGAPGGSQNVQPK
jgi:hypothetical protein